ncbi:DUF255 domain-containing protein [Streptomyces sp. RPA4-5]|nr:DUF255 domain-containing protein [Streptomyces sp. RPA4-5]
MWTTPSAPGSPAPHREWANPYPNRLAHETSLHPRRHARNAVDWWPWSDAAFEEARRRGVPVLLSVGYWWQ